MLRIPHCLESRLTDGGKVSALLTGRALLPRNYFSASDTHFCYRLSKPLDLVRLEGLVKLKNIHSPHRAANPHPSGLQYSAPTTTLPCSLQ
jgi:hypothetical protein